ncbi:DUF397 domain-containing protein [Actinosynnema sp. CS-041913]|uniref:DUF397 domain-containing protein n=1 Tax=Actinosynnema sp. CS-041913 TaxID=3239917 RepID=UPI003D8A8F33
MTWRKSSHSTDQANCVEIRHDDKSVAVRDSKNADGPVLVFPQVDWRVFVR